MLVMGRICGGKLVENCRYDSQHATSSFTLKHRSTPNSPTSPTSGRAFLNCLIAELPFIAGINFV